ncbi:hypothetical protein E2562_036158 [Oryza meyeriana var. granulata]|uniref:Uncharacterized protein n=1 Tax=Oryza meyeriana var. granulata TaxID=110450 RepID=A0A6G1DAM2_9ORYZ|nr:hypothetical protein E2562_036158 [Oryza meyeriana var. granulata]
MAWSYVKMSMVGTAAACSNDDKIMAAVVVLTQTPRKCPWGGSVLGHKTYKRDRIAADWQLNQDYFVERPLYNEEHFRRRFRMRQELFLRIVDEVTAKNRFFKQRRNAARQLGFSALHKCTVALKMLAYGGPADELDDHLKMGESTVLKSLKEFVLTVIKK